MKLFNGFKENGARKAEWFVAGVAAADTMQGPHRRTFIWRGTSAPGGAAQSIPERPTSGLLESRSSEAMP